MIVHIMLIIHCEAGKKRPTYFDCNFVKYQQISMLFSQLDLKMNDTWRYEFHPTHLINVATLPCKNRNTEHAREHQVSFSCWLQNSHQTTNGTDSFHIMFWWIMYCKWTIIWQQVFTVSATSTHMHKMVAPAVNRSTDSALFSHLFYFQWHIKDHIGNRKLSVSKQI